MARNDFAAYFLKGLYEGGVGNPAVAESRKQSVLDQQYKQAQLDQEAAKNGQIPATPRTPAAEDMSHPDHPVMSQVLDKMKGLVSGIAGGPGPQPLQTAFVTDPAKLGNRTLYQDPATGDFSGTKSPGYVPVPFKNQEDAAKELSSTSDRKLKREEMKRTKAEGEDDKYRSYFTKVQEDMNAGWKSRMSNAAKLEGIQLSGERILTLGNQTGWNPDSRQQEEMAIAVQNLLSNVSGGSEREVEALVPKSLVGNVNKIAEWWTNNPRGLEQQKFALRLRDTATREMELAKDQIRSAKADILAAHKSKLHPDDYKTLLQTSDIDMNSIDPLTGRYKRKINPSNPQPSSPGTVTPQDQEAITWAKKNPLDPRSQKILQLHGLRS